MILMKYSTVGKLIFFGGITCALVALVLFIVFLVLSRGTGKRLKRQLEQEYRGY